MTFYWKGCFEVSGGSLRVADPCHSSVHEDNAVIDGAMNGWWSAYRVTYDTGKDYPMLFVTHNAIKFHEKVVEGEWTEDTVTTASGVIGVFSEDKYRCGGKALWWEGVTKAVQSQGNLGVIPFGAVNGSVEKDYFYHCCLLTADNKTVGLYIDLNLDAYEEVDPDEMVDVARTLSRQRFEASYMQNLPQHLKDELKMY